MRDQGLILLLALAACGRAPSLKPTAGARADTTAVTAVEGRVRVVGPHERAQVVLSGAAGDVALLGPLAAELRRLVGMTLRVRGAPRTNPAGLPPRGFEVTDYEILAVNGERPLVGILVKRDRGLWLAGRDTLELIGAPADLLAHVGAKVYVLGPRADGRLYLKSYGVIRESGR